MRCLSLVLGDGLAQTKIEAAQLSPAVAPMPSPKENHLPFDRPQLSRLVAERSWDWARELCAPLRLDLQIFDTALRPQLPSPSSSPWADVPGGGSRVEEAAVQAMRTRRVQHVATDEATVVMAPLVVHAEVVGVLGLGHRRHGQKGPRGGTPERLHQVGAWLASAAARHLASAAGHVHDLTPLIRLLGSAPVSGSDRDVISLFAEAMAVWHDVEVVGYVEVGHGAYAREVTLGARPDSGELVTLPGDAIPAPLRLSPLSAADAEGLAPSAAQEAIATTLTRRHGQSHWLLVFTGETDACDVQLLLNYVAALDMAIGHLTSAACAGVTATALRHAPGERPLMRDGLRAVLSDVSTRLAADSVALIAEFPACRTPIRVGSTNEVLPKPYVFDRSRLAVVKRGTGGEAVLIGVHRRTGGDFTPLERLVLETTAENILTWGVRASARRSHEEPPSAAVFERLAQEVLEHGSAVTAVVVATTLEPSSRVQSVPVDQLRRGLRQSDEVFLLRSGEAGLLLRDTTAADAVTVTKRIDATLCQLHDGPPIRVRTIGFETRLPGAGAAAGIIQAARSNAKRPVDAR